MKGWRSILVLAAGCAGWSASHGLDTRPAGDEGSALAWLDQIPPNRASETTARFRDESGLEWVDENPGRLECHYSNGVFGVTIPTAPSFDSGSPVKPRIRWADASRNGRPFSKDPSVIRHGGLYLLYYSMPPSTNVALPPGWAIGILQSTDLVAWRKVGELLPEQDCDRQGLCAPDAVVLNDRVHLFYQTYGNGRLDAICHAVSEDGVNFVRDASNPVFRPQGNWTSGRAIDAHAKPVGDRLLLWFATRDPSMKTQMLGVAGAALNSDFGRNAWTQLGDGPILAPELPWERECIEAPSVLRRGRTLYLFYAGGYNNEPQQIGVATSTDGIAWKRWSDQPLLAHGQPGEWNSSESGHPGIFEDGDGRTFLFFQGNHDHGRTWFLSVVEVGWNERGPFLLR